MSTASLGTDLQVFSFDQSGSNQPWSTGASWTQAHWLVALLPGTFFALTNFAQNTAIIGGFARPVFFLVLLASFLVTYNLFAVVLRVAWEAPPAVASGKRVNRQAFLIHTLIVSVGGLLQLLGIAMLTAAVREPANWTASILPYFYEVAITCAPIWLFAYVISIAVLRSVSHHQRLAVPSSGSVRLELRADGRVRYVDVKNIVMIEAMGNYVRIVTTDRDLVPRTSLSALESALPGDKFIRTHRSTLVRGALISEIQRAESGAYSAILSSGHVVPLSRRRLSAVRNALKSRQPPETFVTTS